MPKEFSTCSPGPDTILREDSDFRKPVNSLSILQVGEVDSGVSELPGEGQGEPIA